MCMCTDVKFVGVVRALLARVLYKSALWYFIFGFLLATIEFCCCNLLISDVTK